ncbi:MAG: thioredoxin family protein [Lachnospiraceae bacterium]|nr:thioredoxin family protein [Lachnospiraceae bacterium]
MIDLNRIAAGSPLLDEKTRETLRGIFAKLNRDVELKAVVELKEDKSAEMASFLKAIAGLSERIKLELYEPSEGGELGMDTAHLPAVGLFLDGVYQRAAFHGVPGGKEINSFVIGIYNLAGPGQEMNRGTGKKIEKLKNPVDVKVVVSLACHHCPGMVINCQRIAMMNPVIRMEAYDGNLYPDLVERYNIQRVPVVVLNDKDVFVGPRSLEDMVQLLKDAR